MARTAGVSVSTVSNVLNHPHLVAENTKQRVLSVITRLRFEPNATARSLRLGSLKSTTQAEDHWPELSVLGHPESTDMVQDAPSEASSTASSVNNEPTHLERGKRVTLHVGHEVLTGTVDAVVSDESCFWIWTDDGMGRRMIHADDLVGMHPAQSAR
ncbi:LacI family DNA-binding transcriptional regulator [Paenarthrobacter nicotinovorans]|uniref:LacI family DNA-binding transcriptional regulator n=1 Tax=Paenarthrobacter nicotinovorans TaxID=29320 RepID=UPI003747983F